MQSWRRLLTRITGGSKDCWISCVHSGGADYVPSKACLNAYVALKEQSVLSLRPLLCSFTQKDDHLTTIDCRKHKCVTDLSA